MVVAGCAGTQPRIGMAVEDFTEACAISDLSRGRLVRREGNREIYYCDFWKTHYVFEDGILVSIEQPFGELDEPDSE